MKKYLLALIAGLLLMPAAASAQDDERNSGQFGVFFNYLRLDEIDRNQFGVGVRLGFGVHDNVQLEGEGAYDFRTNRTETVEDVFGVPQTFEARLRTLTFLAGPKFHTNGPIRIFGTVKGGLLNFKVSAKDAPAGFTDQVGSILDGDTKPALYPAGGVEFFADWFGFRAEVGDEMYWGDDDVHHNLRITVGPSFRW